MASSNKNERHLINNANVPLKNQHFVSPVVPKHQSALHQRMRSSEPNSAYRTIDS